MAEVSVGDAVGAGFELIRRQPLSILVWGVIVLAMQSLALWNIAPLYSQLISQALANPGAGAAGFQQFSAQIAQRAALTNLLSFVQGFVAVVIYCAAFRAVLRPEARGFAYLRVGMAELFAFIVFIGLIIAMTIVLVIFALVVALLAGTLAVAHAGVVSGLVIFIAVIAAIWASVYVMLRFSLLGPMIVADGKFHLFDSWTLTRGRTGQLFVVGLLLLVILLVGEMVVLAIYAAVGFGALSATTGGLQNLPAMLREHGPALFSQALPWLVVMAVISTPLLGAVYAILAAPWARVYRDLAGPDLAETFS